MGIDIRRRRTHDNDGRRCFRFDGVRRHSACAGELGFEESMIMSYLDAGCIGYDVACAMQCSLEEPSEALEPLMGSMVAQPSYFEDG